jgi:hypothetical protein
VIVFVRRMLLVVATERASGALSPGTVAKSDVLAYITHYGENEIVVRREHVCDVQ